MKKEKITVRRVNPQSLLKIPDELTKQKLPEDAVFELESHFKHITEKYGLRLD